MSDQEKLALDDILKDGDASLLSQFKSIDGHDMITGLGKGNFSIEQGAIVRPLPDIILPFPLEIFPANLSEVITKASESIGVQPDLIAVPMLVIAGSAIGAGMEIEIKQGWREGANLYGAIVSPPGDRKSPAIKAAAGPIHKKQREFSEKYKEEMELYRKDLAAFRVKFTSWKSKYKKALKDGEPFNEEQPAEPHKPTLQRTFTTDSTTEALSEILCGNPFGILLIKDELSGWVRSMDQYRSGKGADLQFYLSAWSRAHIIVDRKNNPDPKSIPMPFISVIGGIPPDVLEELVGEKGHEDGFLHRILFSFPSPFCSEEDSFMKPFPDVLADVWNEIYLRLRDLPIKSPPPNPRVVKLTIEAQETWIEFVKTNRQELVNPDFPVYLRGPWAKFEGHCARFALIIHQIRYVTGFSNSEDIDRESMRSAVKLVNYFKSHTKGVYRKLHITMADKKALHLLDWIKRHKRRCTAGDLIAHGAIGIQKASDANKALMDLMDRGFGHFIEQKSARGAGRKYFVLFDSGPSNPVSS